METTIIDRELLVSYVDKLIATKYPGQPVEEHAAEREEAIKLLDNRISDEMFEHLSGGRLAELRTMIDNGKITTPKDLTKFYQTSGLNLERIIKVATDKFANEFMKGERNDA